MDDLVFVGTYTTRGQGKGIYTYLLDRSTGALSCLSTMAAVADPSFLVVHPDRRHLYAVSEGTRWRGAPGGGVAALSIDATRGELTLLNEQPSGGDYPCYLCVDSTGRFLLLANYGGSVAVFPIGQDGRLGPAADRVEHHGQSVDPERQQEAHAHCLVAAPASPFVLSADLGLDRVIIYRLDPDTGLLAPHDVPWVAVPPGSGPRHLAFHPNGAYVYLANELGSTLMVFRFDPIAGTLQPLQTASLLPASWQGANSGADVHVAPSGRFVYASNRGHDSIAIFAVEPGTGLVSLVGHQSTLGHTPRNFAIDPAGALLLVANQHSDTVVAFAVDQRTGELAPTGAVTHVPSPVCVTLF
jgi:6-phosphogluconolactonase